MPIYKPSLLDKFKDFVNGLKSNWDAYEGHVEDFETAKGIITDTFDETRTYAVGDYAIYENVLYKCVEAIEEAGEWDADKWTATNIAEEFKSHLEEYATLLAGGTEQTATLQNGWTGVLRYRKNLLGQVNVIGRITAGTTDNGTIISNLPEGYRPRYTVAIGVYDRGSGLVKIPLLLSDTGDLVIRASGDNLIPAGRVVDFEIFFMAR